MLRALALTLARDYQQQQEPPEHSYLFLLVFLPFVFSASGSCSLLHVGFEGRVLGLVVVNFLLELCER